MLQEDALVWQQNSVRNALPLLFLQNSKYLLTFSLPKLYDNGKKRKGVPYDLALFETVPEISFCPLLRGICLGPLFPAPGQFKKCQSLSSCRSFFCSGCGLLFFIFWKLYCCRSLFLQVSSPVTAWCSRASLPRFWLMGAAGTLAFFLGFSLLGVSLDLQSLTAFFYLSCLAVNLVSVIRQKNFWFTVCLLLLLAGDLHVAVYNLHWYLPVGQYHWYQVWWELSTPLIWGFYLPGQLLQAAKMPEICGLRHA